MLPCKIIGALSMVLLLVLPCPACKARKGVPKVIHAEDKATINLKSITGINESQVFEEVRRVNLLPKEALDQIGGMADPGQPFNKTDFVNSNLPMRQLIVAGVSKKYCILSYWQGGIALYFRTDIFELSDRKAKRIWVSQGQGGFTFHDLKEMVESGRMHNDLRTESH
jgi:hypothetical protein